MARSHTCLLAALACAYAAVPKRVTLAIANERSSKLQCSLGAEKLPVIPARTGQLLETEVPAELVCGGVTAEIAGDGYVVARVGDDAAPARPQKDLPPLVLGGMGDVMLFMPLSHVAYANA